ncbi:gluconate 2-dehydrogenase subunit 3 family protein [Membranihabitans maritimus]|uniref:gluconate 2-dehydrogenase subunit 3 family protein n=1 Tax=Membranihabitans maritimus TaxID=2904244 RepID=UPI001F3555D3|nr:gluconate 2-dehydrogenase subunit 3 family protein [Membranihabitans maritimus]
MDRRQALKNTSRIIGAGVFAPAISVFFQGCNDSDIPQDGLPVALSLSQFTTLTILSDIIIPGTKSASASDAKVPEFIDLLVAEIFDSELSNQVQKGLKEIENYIPDSGHHPFSNLSAEEQVLFIQKLDNAAYGKGEVGKFKNDLLENYKSIKGLVLMAYFTSEKGVTENLDYAPVPGEYKACIEAPEEPLITIGNHM